MGKIIKNAVTGNQIEMPDPIDLEVKLGSGVMITETDADGIITYANRKFRELAGYTKEELVGSPHSINRHPDMPNAIFMEMWDTIKSGQYWEGYIKNMTASGSYYLTVVSIKPKLDEDGNIIGYIAGRKIPEKKPMAEALERYKTLIAQEQ